MKVIIIQMKVSPIGKFDENYKPRGKRKKERESLAGGICDS